MVQAAALHAAPEYALAEVLKSQIRAALGVRPLGRRTGRRHQAHLPGVEPFTARRSLGDRCRFATTFSLVFGSAS